MYRLLTSRFGSASRGQAAVETALVLMIIMLLALGTFDLGRGIAAHLALTEATQEGAMYAGYELCNPAASPDVLNDDVEYRITSSSTVEAVENAVVAVPSVPAYPGYITVRSTYNLPVITPLASFIFGPTFALGVEVKATNFHDGACTQ
jgi:Flp pilus assembly protein TadG